MNVGMRNLLVLVAIAVAASAYAADFHLPLASQAEAATAAR